MVLFMKNDSRPDVDISNANENYAKYHIHSTKVKNINRKQFYCQFEHFCHHSTSPFSSNSNCTITCKSKSLLLLTSPPLKVG